MMKRTMALTMMLLVALPWAVLPAGAGSACGPGERGASVSCSFCTLNGSAPEAESLRPGCCRFTPRTEAAPLQASGISASPSPHHSPEAPAALAGVPFHGAHGLIQVVSISAAPPPAHAPPTETTHLLI
jgi:hypothetical protein